MKNIIYYYSGRGNSCVMAQEIARQLPETRVVPFSNKMQYKPDTDVERIGFIFPVINFGVPAHIPQFLIEIVSMKPDCYFFAVVLNGGAPCAVLQQVETALKSCQTKLSAGFLVDVRVLRGMMGNWEEKYVEITQTIGKKMLSPIDRGNLWDQIVLTGCLNSISRMTIHTMDKKFWVDKNCNGCLDCVKSCPVNNITLDNNNPVWHHKCDQCFGCYAWCPQKAIHTGKKDNERLRDRNPKITVQEKSGSLEIIID